MNLMKPFYENSTSTFATTVLPVDIDTAWKTVRNFDHPKGIQKNIKDLTIKGGNMEIGAVRTITFNDGNVVSHRLIEVDELKRCSSWEYFPNDEPSQGVKPNDYDVASVVFHMQLFPEETTKGTFAMIFCRCSSDVTPKILETHKKWFTDALLSLRENLKKN